MVSVVKFLFQSNIQNSAFRKPLYLELYIFLYIFLEIGEKLWSYKKRQKIEVSKRMEQVPTKYSFSQTILYKMFETN